MITLTRHSSIDCAENENSVPSPTDDPGGSSDGGGAKAKGRSAFARRSVSDRLHRLHHESELFVFHNETATAGPDFVLISIHYRKPSQMRC